MSAKSQMSVGIQRGGLRPHRFQTKTKLIENIKKKSKAEKTNKNSSINSVRNRNNTKIEVWEHGDDDVPVERQNTN